MEGFRSRSFTNGRAEMEPHDLRYYSASYASTQASNKEIKLKKAKSTNGSSSFWSLSDPELQRMKRVAGYKVYDVEGKMKGSIRRSFKWIKGKCNRVVHGWN